MKKYKYRIVKKRIYETYTIEKKEITFFNIFSWWERDVGGFHSIEEADKHIISAIKYDLLPEFEVIKEINPYA